MNEEYMECNEFPGGLVIDHYSQFGDDYRKDLLEVTDDSSLQSFRRKWVDIFPELEEEVSVTDLIRVRDSIPEQDKIVETLTKVNPLDPSLHLLNYVIPPTLLYILLQANHYVVSHGIVLLQMYNAGNIQVLPNGKWRIIR